jgi:hypothetical protein
VRRVPPTVVVREINGRPRIPVTFFHSLVESEIPDRKAGQRMFLALV